MKPPLENQSVKSVGLALKKARLPNTIIDLCIMARTADEAANAIGAPVGSIVKSLVFYIDKVIVMVLIAGDKQCVPANLQKTFKLTGTVRKATAIEVKKTTGFTIGGVAPIGLLNPIPIAIDQSLERFPILHAAAGHPTCVFSISFDNLVYVAKGAVSNEIANQE
ncbi:MAG: hypothetical protein CFH06_01304 [Alphaproteobacteria bacterium MarineAlpha3_Bin5]|nr:aminoacyl-tRNA deacylase [Magnetovibrio sp.]PPR77391.1 MAG: hypothetical protein CFH06_01304 [Alphaproteobacteria bacterium MarineAlpha3_Bin5]